MAHATPGRFFNLERRLNVIYACGGGPDATFGKCMGHIEFFNSGMPAGMYGGGGWVREGGRECCANCQGMQLATLNGVSIACGC